MPNGIQLVSKYYFVSIDSNEHFVSILELGILNSNDILFISLFLICMIYRDIKAIRFLNNYLGLSRHMCQ